MYPLAVSMLNDSSSKVHVDSKDIYSLFPTINPKKISTALCTLHPSYPHSHSEVLSAPHARLKTVFAILSSERSYPNRRMKACSHEVVNWCRIMSKLYCVRASSRFYVSLMFQTKGPNEFQSPDDFMSVRTFGIKKQ